MEITLANMLELSAQKYPQLEAVLFEDNRATYAQLNDRVNIRADALMKLGVKKNDHVGTLFSNCMEAIESFFAVWRIGAVLVPLNLRLSPIELAYVINQSDLSAIIFQDQLAETVKGFSSAIPRVDRFLYVGETCPPESIDFEKAVSEVTSPVPAPEVGGEDLATIIFTAGTTGKPKGVMATHSNWM